MAKCAAIILLLVYSRGESCWMLEQCKESNNSLMCAHSEVSAWIGIGVFAAKFLATTEGIFCKFLYLGLG